MRNLLLIESGTTLQKLTCECSNSHIIISEWQTAAPHAQYDCRVGVDPDSLRALDWLWKQWSCRFIIVLVYHRGVLAIAQL